MPIPDENLLLFHRLHPGGDREDAGSRGERLHKLADWLGANQPSVTTDSTSTTMEMLQTAAELMENSKGKSRPSQLDWQALQELLADPFYQSAAVA